MKKAVINIKDCNFPSVVQNELSISYLVENISIFNI